MAEVRLGKMLDKSKNKGKYYQYLRNINVRWDGFDLSDLLEMRFEDNELEKYSLKSGDLIMCEGGEPARCAVWNNEIENMKIQKALHRIRVGKGVNNRFLMYIFHALSFSGFLTPYISGATIKHLTGEKLKEIPVNYPPLTEQQSIVSTLDSLKSKVDRLQENYEKISAECGALKQAILRQVFE